MGPRGSIWPRAHSQMLCGLRKDATAKNRSLMLLPEKSGCFRRRLRIDAGGAVLTPLHLRRGEAMNRGLVRRTGNMPLAEIGGLITLIRKDLAQHLIFLKSSFTVLRSELSITPVTVGYCPVNIDVRDATQMGLAQYALL